MPEVKEVVEDIDGTQSGATPSAGGEAQGGAGDGGKKSYADGKYDSVEGLEAGAVKGQEHIETLESEATRSRERISDLEQERADREAQDRARTTDNDQKTGRQNAEQMWKDGKFMDSIGEIVRSQLSEFQKPIQDRAAASEQQHRKLESSMVIKELGNDSLNFPKFNELQDDMAKIIAGRIKNNPDYSKSFSDSREMIEDAYSVAARAHPEMFKPDPSIAASAGGGMGSGAQQFDGSAPQRQVDVSKEAQKKEAEARIAFGLEDNPFQHKLSPQDAVAQARAKQLADLAKGD